MNNPTTLQTTLGEHTIHIETGRMAKQASGSVVVRCGDSMVLVTAVAGEHREDARFFPLVCDYVEKRYAGGRIPGGFLKREGRLSDHETLTCRLMDRPIRPLFPDGYKGDTQLVATVISHDAVHDTDMLAITGASAALTLSEAPFFGPIAAVRVGRHGGRFIANPTLEELPECDLNIVVVSSRDAIVMVEGEAQEVPEQVLLDALDFAFEAVQPLIDVQLELQAAHGKPKREFIAPEPDAALMARIAEAGNDRYLEAFDVAGKFERKDAISAVRNAVLDEVLGEDQSRRAEASSLAQAVEKDLMRKVTVQRRIRLDGRSPRTVRAIQSEVSVLPRVHGSSLFTRGETQTLVAATLGTSRDAQMIENVSGKRDEYFMLHYNFPPFSVGEVKMLRGPGRREVGHGFLANRALRAVLPDFEEFPYVLRLVSEVLESNGSSSMATVCGGSLALMDAGVPLKAPVAGIAMGLIAEEGDYVVLSDILGDEDHLGDMDFKVAGTRKGITALQMDIKIKGLSRQIMEEALMQAREGRLHILGCMAQALDASRPELSDYAPRITTISISPDRIRDVIGSGGKTIRSICDRTGCNVEVNDDGTVKIASSDQKAAEEAIRIIRALTQEARPGEVYLGTVSKIMDFGAFVTILPGTDGLCHISELSHERVERTEDVVREGEEILVKCMGFERGGKIRLSRKEALGLEPTVQAVQLDL
ncbi:MAG: polyribonucleotide nucleotidyltransferase [Deltaproteobacteria bacterium]|nr:MAG: polyribonucleotide nucleotidyltransferase [Deltaproteobacteria bacterium]